MAARLTQERPELAGEMTHTFNAGCDYSVFPEEWGIQAPEYGTEEMNVCEEPFFAISSPAT